MQRYSNLTDVRMQAKKCQRRRRLRWPGERLRAHASNPETWLLLVSSSCVLVGSV